MTALLAVLAVGLGPVLAFDGLTRPTNSLPKPPDRRALLQAAAGLIGATAAYAHTGWLIAALAGAALRVTVPSLLSQNRSTAKAIELTDAFADVAVGLRDAVRTLGIGYGIDQADGVVAVGGSAGGSWAVSKGESRRSWSFCRRAPRALPRM